MCSLKCQRSKQFMYRYLTNNAEAESYDLAILVKDSNFDADMLQRYYLDNLALVGLGHLNVIFYPLEYKTKKPKAKHMQEYMLGLNDLFIQNKIRYLYVADANYFKHITKENKPMANLTSFYKVDNYQACFGINYSSIKYSEDNRDKLMLSLQAIKDKVQESSTEIDTVQVAATNSNRSANAIMDTFNSINTNSASMVTKSSQIDSMTLQVQQVSSGILTNITVIAASAEETVASVQEGLAGMQEQSAGLEMIANNFRDLEKLIQVLENIS